jgi:hypothetical protein
MGEVSRGATARQLLWGGLVAACAACAPSVTSSPVAKDNRDVTTQHLTAGLEAELVAIRSAPLAAVGMGEKAYLPYELLRGDALVRSDDPAVVPRLAAEALDGRNDLVFRFVVLQILGLRADAAVDAALIRALGDPALTPLAAYLLGRPGYKGYPARDRPSVAPLLRALAAHLDDTGVYRDPWYHNTRATADLVLGAFVRIAGPEAFRFADADERNTIGYTLRLPDAERAGLLGQARAWPIPPE